MRDLELKLTNRRGYWLLRKLKRLLRGELVGNSQTVLKTLKSGIMIEGGMPANLLKLLRIRMATSDFGGLDMVVCDSAIGVCDTFSDGVTPDLEVTLSRLAGCESVKSVKLDLTKIVETLEEDAFLPTQTIFNFMRCHMQLGRTYVFLVEDCHQVKTSLIVQTFRPNPEKNDHMQWRVLRDDYADLPASAILVHLDYLSKHNEDAFAGLSSD